MQSGRAVRRRPGRQGEKTAKTKFKSALTTMLYRHTVIFSARAGEPLRGALATSYSLETAGEHYMQYMPSLGWERGVWTR